MFNYSCVYTDYLTDENIDPNMQAAIYRGLYQDRVSWTPDFDCHSNCTWPGVYTVLGVKGTCENVTVATLATKRCFESTQGPQHCNMITPSGVKLNTTFFATVYGTAAALNANTTDMYTDRGWSPTIAKYAFYDRQIDSVGYPKESDPEAVWDCSLSLVANRYSQVRSEFLVLNIGKTEQIALEEGQLGLHDDPDEGPSAYHMTFNQIGIPELTLSARDLGALKGFFLSNLFTGTTLRGESQPAPQLGCSQAFANNGAREATARLAKSMTDALQQNPASGRNFGSYSLAVTNILVKWEWLALLVALEAAGSVLLIGTIMRARRQKDVHLWKSSQSALLFSHIDNDGLLVAPSESPKDLEKEVRRITAQLMKA